MALATILYRFSFPKRFVSLPSCLRLKLFSSFYSSTSSFQNPNPEKLPSATWLHQWDPPPPSMEQKTKTIKPPSSIERIVHRLRTLEPELEEEEENPVSKYSALYGNQKMGELLEKKLTHSDWASSAGKELPCEREVTMEVQKRRRIRAPTLAELTIEHEELKRLRRLGKGSREKITVPKAGLTAAVLDKIHGVWKEKEVVMLKFHEDLAHNMRTAHELVQRRTGGVVTWQSGRFMVVYRGAKYKWPSRCQSLAAEPFSAKTSNEDDKLFTSDVSSKETTSTLENKLSLSSDTQFYESMNEEEKEFNEMLDGLGPRFVEWWGTGLLPVDADLLPPTIPGYEMPLRMIPTGTSPRLKDAEMTSLRKLAKKLPCHFALGRNRHHQGLASSILKLWEKSLVVKIAIKPGIQNTNSKLMADELKNLTGGVLLLRNKYYVVMYRGKDFLPTAVATALAERGLVKDVQEAEGAHNGLTTEPCVEGKEEYTLVDTFARYQKAQARRERKVTVQKQTSMTDEIFRVQSALLLKNLEHKFATAHSENLRAMKLLGKIEASMVPINLSNDQKVITDEERSVFRRIGLQMKSYLPIGIRGVFNGVIWNMHLHWKHREITKLISKQKTLSFVENLAQLLEYESGGILVAIERVPKGFALVYHRGKKYQRPCYLRHRNILTKSNTSKYVAAMQRHKALSQHIQELKRNIKQLKSDLGCPQGTESDNAITIQSGHTSDEWTQRHPYAL